MLPARTVSALAADAGLVEGASEAAGRRGGGTGSSSAGGRAAMVTCGAAPVGEVAPATLLAGVRRSSGEESRETDGVSSGLDAVLMLSLRYWAKYYIGHGELLGQRLGPRP